MATLQNKLAIIIRPLAANECREKETEKSK